MSVKIALAGNPNCGKTTLFNALTGSNQFVGNWPGVTVEKKEGKLKGHKDVILTDLPGIYSLSPYTLEEVVARNYILQEKPDAIINIVDGTNIERNLYLTTQLAELIDSLDGDEKIGARIVQKALEAPLFHIVTNAGLEGAVVINKVKESKVGVGFDAYNEEYVDMIQAGILDPVKVTRSALQNATSVSATLLTTESVVSTIKEPAPAMPAGADGGMGMM